MPIYYPEKITFYPRSTQIFIRRIVYRIDSGKNALIGVFGPTGGGKSLAALQLMRGMYLFRHGKEPPEDYLINHVKFKARDFLESMNNPALKKKEEWLWDESGIDIGHKSFATIQNRVIGWLIQTFRHLQQVVFFTTPSLSFIDASVRKMLHYFLEVKTIDYEKQICIVKPIELQYNIRLDKTYFKNIKYHDQKGFVYQLKVIGVPKIPDDLEIRYKAEQSKFTKDLNIKIYEILEKLDDKKEKKELSPWDKLTDKQRRILIAVCDGKRREREIEEYSNLPVNSNVRGVFRAIAKTGINIFEIIRIGVVSDELASIIREKRGLYPDIGKTDVERFGAKVNLSIGSILPTT